MTTHAAHPVERGILERYTERTPRSREQHEVAARFLPGGVTRNLGYFSPYPLYMERGEGCYLYDDDGNAYIDHLNAYSTMIHGHADPDVVRASQEQLGKGTCLSAAFSNITKLACLLCDRIPAMDLIRFANSGTEATLFAIRAARAFTRKDMFLKIEGGWHGAHDFVEVSVSPDMQTEGFPSVHLEEEGIPVVWQDEK